MEKIKISDVKWREDKATQAYVQRHKNRLSSPSEMEHVDLGIATTFCRNLQNPYVDEIVRRAHMEQEFQKASTDDIRMKVLTDAGKRLGFVVV